MKRRQSAVKDWLLGGGRGAEIGGSRRPSPLKRTARTYVNVNGGVVPGGQPNRLRTFLAQNQRLAERRQQILRNRWPTTLIMQRFSQPIPVAPGQQS